MSVIRLVQKPGQDSVRTLCLEELGKICTGDRGTPPDTLEEEHVTALSHVSGDVCTLLQALARFLDLRRSYSLSFWTLICQGDWLPDEDMPPGFFDVQPMSGMDTVAYIWKGSDSEVSARASAHAPRKRKRADIPEFATDALDDDVELEEHDVQHEQSEDDPAGSDPDSETDDDGRGVGDVFFDPDSDVDVDGAAIEAAAADSAVPRDDGAADGALPPGLEFVNNAAATELCFPLSGGTGALRYSLTERWFKAACPRHTNCFRQRTAKSSSGLSAWSEGQGRPLGSLVSWLQTADRYETRTEHMAAPTQSFVSRQEARMWFLRHAGAEQFSADHERERHPGENLEPRQIR